MKAKRRTVALRRKPSAISRRLDIPVPAEIPDEPAAILRLAGKGDGRGVAPLLAATGQMLVGLGGMMSELGTLIERQEQERIYEDVKADIGDAYKKLKKRLDEIGKGIDENSKIDGKEPDLKSPEKQQASNSVKNAATDAAGHQSEKAHKGLHQATVPITTGTGASATTKLPPIKAGTALSKTVHGVAWWNLLIWIKDTHAWAAAKPKDKKPKGTPGMTYKNPPGTSLTIGVRQIEEVGAHDAPLKAGADKDKAAAKVKEIMDAIKDCNVPTPKQAAELGEFFDLPKIWT